MSSWVFAQWVLVCTISFTDYVISEAKKFYQQDTVHGLCQKKAFDGVPRLVIWWALRKPGIEEWLVRHIQSNVWKCQKQSVCWLQSEWRVQCERGPLWHVSQGHWVKSSVWKRAPVACVSRTLEFSVKEGPCGMCLKDIGVQCERGPLWHVSQGHWSSVWKRAPVACVSRTLEFSVKEGPCGMCLKDIGTNSIFCGGCSSWIHK